MAAFGVLCISTTLRTQVRPAIEFISGKEGLRPRFTLFAGIAVFMPYDVTGTSIPRVRLLGHPDVLGSRRDGNGGRFARSPCLFLTQYTRCCSFSLCTAAVHGAPSHNRWRVVDTPLPVKTQGRDHELSFNSSYAVCGFQVSLRKVQQGPTVTPVVTSPGSRNGTLR